MSNYWIYLSVLAMLITAVGIILIKYITLSKYDYGITSSFAFVIVGIMAAVYLLFNYSESSNFLYNIKQNTRFAYLILFFAFLIIMKNICMKDALKYSPNIGYSHLIINLNIIITLIASYFLFNQKINWQTGIGILISLIGVSIVAYYSNN